MTARHLDGRAAARIRNRALREEAASLRRPPGLAVILVGDDPASAVYVRRKGVVAGRLGYRHRQIDLPADVDQGTVEAAVDALNADPEIDGILVQLPLPAHLDADAIIGRIRPDKDVDGLTEINAGRLALGRPGLVPCTPRGCLELLADAGVELAGARAVVIGRSNIVGRPLAHLLEQANATVTLCHSRSRGIPDLARQADVLAVAVGRPRWVGAGWVKPGAVVLDVGINRLADGTLCGDVDTAAVVEVAGAITPVPGGVGPMTIAMLMRNTFEAARAHQQG